MRQLKSAVARAIEKLSNVQKQLLEAQNEYVLWRHQLVGERNPLSENAMGLDSRGKVWKTRTYLIQAARQGEDQQGRTVIYTRIEPVYGDLIITLVGQPTTKEEAQKAPKAGVYRIVDFDVRRAPSGRIVGTKCICVPDRSGHWHNYD